MTKTSPDQISLVLNQIVNESGDAAAGIQTTATMSVGDEFRGTLGSSGDADWVRISLTAGEKYVFTVWGTGGSASGVDDTTLTLYDANGSRILFNDDSDASNGVRFSQISYTAATSGTYYLKVDNYSDADTGNYILEAATDVFTVDQVVNQLVEHGWGFSTPVAFDHTNITVNLTGLTAEGRQLALWALEAWEAVSTLRFTTTTSSSADIIFDDNQPGAFAGPGQINPNTGTNTQSTVNVSTSWINAYGSEIGSYSFLTYMHEIGHALGLMHAGPYDGNATYGSDNTYRNDSLQMTIMSYFNANTNTFVNGSEYNPITPMIADIAGIWQLYGTPADVNAGNTVWGHNSNVGGYLGEVSAILFDGAADRNRILDENAPIGLTIVDTGGFDTLDLSTASGTQTVNMAAGGISDIGGLTGNLVIAQGTVLEKYVGGAGRDNVTGNDVGNVIKTGGGDDKLFGQSGNDTLDGGAGNDTLSGGSDWDQLTGGDGNDRVWGGDGRDKAWLGSGNDFFFDNAQAGSNGADTVYGGGGHDKINGGGGNDVFYGDAGNDTLSGGDGDDVLSGGTDWDQLTGGNGNDRIWAGNGRDKAWMGNGDDIFYDNDQTGTNAVDTVYGGAGKDRINGGGGDDAFYGDSGNDTLFGGEGNDILSGGTDWDQLSGGNGNDRVWAGNGSDKVWLGGGNDTFFDNTQTGSNGKDTVYGGLGDDTINLGGGDDWASGGAGADTFVWNADQNTGADLISDFEDGTDILKMKNITFAELSISQTANGAEVSWDNGSILLEGVASSAITADDFVFV
ncbi:M10 family metallopeptidase C-terminal domain-containing protein (plasmid) [Aliiroseovarius crassostreae]|uniref:M10 family metallopeptidase C-terminal domain-containing protein n=1 Tax=Aliiroseovarius crassostreae TaxID=154981 RepID=UPI0021FA413C|nr:matrixin family metalloprotease [Aliiroseovarius crassostreae]UWQ03416.1 M10 family metallopeptidase C-terminal domain-containing protein [Aliiroseovarius crassostreae]